MYKVVEGNSRGLTKVEKFIGLINETREFFDDDRDIFVARAPGRLDVMGGIADYSGSLVLEMPIAEATLAAVQKSDDRIVRIVSLAGDAVLDFEFDLSFSGTYEELRGFFSPTVLHWASYIAGVFFVLQKELGIKFQNGARILISSDIPIGKGVSSSAALEVATMQAVCAAFGIKIEPLCLALLCQKVENLIVGAPCGVMDQVSSHCGMENSLLEVLCQPASILGSVSIPESFEFWGIDSGVRHAVVGSDYSSVRAGAFMGYRIVADIAELEVQNTGTGSISDTKWRGHLSNINPQDYRDHFEMRIPVELSGAEFLERYHGTTDPVVKIDPEKRYPVKASTEHGIMECPRVREFSKGLKTGDESIGKLMFQSHESYRACGLTEPGTERIVELVRESLDRGLYGARITGGGSGGTVAILARTGSRGVIEEIASQYARETGRKPYIFHGSSPGCATFSHLRLRWMP